ncbi:4-hydroxy-tetrahydrodipicolinate reductase [Sphingomonas jatrophae]|uniref:4-hydroxy-tetrahydrodipicolinate reductase n=1 Tax=Sphingomonas jatrophae TaxID=1166337 RepID=A0A1I6JH56_9SPHN|nr:4-hydroxy-tetrahydrodipicolinate reductase [Sphingomonas jatrophae]SFR78306.1 dihydrodipicolinate reductase [Sphingomonas jatrophae]
MTRIGLLGAAGRMGRAIADAAPTAGATIAGGVDRDGVVIGSHEDALALARDCDVLVDFSAPSALAGHLEAARTANRPIVIGTTGLAAEHHALIDEAAADIPILQAANTSLGVNLLARLVQQAAQALGEDWDIEVVEMHHRHKVDAPSGTALLLGQAAAGGRGIDLADVTTERTGLRTPGSIGFAALRGGSVAGDHMVVLATEGERIELGHRAENRGIFARGAVRAALWLAGRPAGRYTMGDVLGL